MPRGNSAVYAATAVFLLGLALVLTGAVLLGSNQGLALALIACGFAVVLIGSWVSTLQRSRPDARRGA